MVSRIFNPNIEAWYLEINQVNIAFFSECCQLCFLDGSDGHAVPSCRIIICPTDDFRYEYLALGIECDKSASAIYNEMS